jgi:pimeloyl-ACP methyl ester carboxylesterase
MQAARDRLEDLYARHGRKVSLIGWSVGGLYARQLAKQAPALVRLVITLGSPLNGTPSPADLWRLVQDATGRGYGLPETEGPLEQPPPVPTTAIFSRSDGIVAWQDSIQPEGPMAENIEVESSHLGMAVNPLVLYAIADRLAQREGQWQPFHREGLRAAFYRGSRT